MANFLKNTMHTYYLGIGSNVQRIHNIKSALNYLSCSFKGLEQSNVYRSPSYGFEGHDFYNLVVKIKTIFSPHLLKAWLNYVEDLHGRDRNKPRYSNRTLDIDLLLCDDLIVDDEIIQIPRDEILKRKYVLKPLVDLAPDFIHPVAKKRLAEIWQTLEFNDDSQLNVITYQ